MPWSTELNILGGFFVGLINASTQHCSTVSPRYLIRDDTASASLSPTCISHAFPEPPFVSPLSVKIRAPIRRSRAIFPLPKPPIWYVSSVPMTSWDQPPHFVQQRWFGGLHCCQHHSRSPNLLASGRGDLHDLVRRAHHVIRCRPVCQGCTLARFVNICTFLLYSSICCQTNLSLRLDFLTSILFASLLAPAPRLPR